MVDWFCIYLHNSHEFIVFLHHSAHFFEIGFGRFTIIKLLPLQFIGVGQFKFISHITIARVIQSWQPKLGFKSETDGLSFYFNWIVRVVSSLCCVGIPSHSYADD